MSKWVVAVAALASTATTSANQAETKRSPTIHDMIDVAAKMAPVAPVELGGGVPLPLGKVAASIEQHHPVLAAAERRQIQAEGKALAARGGFDPTLKVDAGAWPEGFYNLRWAEAKLEQATPLWGTSLFGSYRVGRGTIPTYEEERETLDEGEFKAGINVPLWRDGPIDERRASIRQNERGARAAFFEQETTRLDLLLDGAAAYWKWVAAGQVYQVALDLVRLAELRDSQLARKVQQGAVAEISRAENLRAVLDRRQDLVAAQRGLEQAAIKLSLFIRDEGGQPNVPQPQRLPGLPEATPPAQSELEIGKSDAMERRPEIAFYREAIERARVGVRLATNQLAPEVDFEVAVAKDLGTASDSKDIDTLGPTELKLGVNFKMPLFMRKARGKAKEAEAKLSEVQEKARFQRDKIENQILDLWSALNARAQQSVLAYETYRIAETVAAAERRRFDLGVTTLFIVNLREQKSAEAARKLVKAKADYALTRSAWALATRTALP